MYTLHFPHSAFCTLHIFYTPHFPHSSFCTLWTFHTPHFLRSPLRTSHSAQFDRNNDNPVVKITLSQGGSLFFDRWSRGTKSLGIYDHAYLYLCVVVQRRFESITVLPLLYVLLLRGTEDQWKRAKNHHYNKLNKSSRNLCQKCMEDKKSTLRGGKWS